MYKYINKDFDIQEIEKQISYFDENFIKKLKIKRICSFKTIIVLKSYNRTTGMPVCEVPVVFKNETLDLYEQFPDYFEEYKGNKYALARQFFEDKLREIECIFDKIKLRREYRNKSTDSWSVFRNAVKYVFQCNVIQMNILANFLREHFSFERNVFREYNFEMFTEKECIFVIKDFAKKFQLISEDSHFEPESLNKSNGYKKTGLVSMTESWHRVEYKKFFEGLKNKPLKDRIYQEAIYEYYYFLETFVHRNHKSRNFCLKAIKNFKEIKKLKEYLKQVSVFKNFYFYKTSLFIPKKMKTDNVVNLAYYTRERKLSIHPLKHYVQSFDLNNFTLKEIDDLCGFLASPIYGAGRTQFVVLVHQKPEYLSILMKLHKLKSNRATHGFARMINEIINDDIPVEKIKKFINLKTLDSVYLQPHFTLNVLLESNSLIYDKAVEKIKREAIVPAEYKHLKKIFAHSKVEIKELDVKLDLRLNCFEEEFVLTVFGQYIFNFVGFERLKEMNLFQYKCMIKLAFTIAERNRDEYSFNSDFKGFHVNLERFVIENQNFHEALRKVLIRKEEIPF